MGLRTTTSSSLRDICSGPNLGRPPPGLSQIPLVDSPSAVPFRFLSPFPHFQFRRGRFNIVPLNTSVDIDLCETSNLFGCFLPTPSALPPTLSIYDGRDQSARGSQSRFEGSASVPRFFSFSPPIQQQLFLVYSLVSRVTPF